MIAARAMSCRGRGDDRIQIAGRLLSTAGLVAFVYAVISAPEHGWTSARVLVAAIGGLALLSVQPGLLVGSTSGLPPRRRG
jgi:hypothetical protein